MGGRWEGYLLFKVMAQGSEVVDRRNFGGWQGVVEIGGEGEGFINGLIGGKGGVFHGKFVSS